MRLRRLIGFLLSIALGLALGLYLGWGPLAPKPEGTDPQSLRADYRADYVLMVAEIYQKDGDLQAAIQRLTPLGETPLRLVQQAILTAQQLGYHRTDIESLARLFQALQTQPLSRTPTPP